MFHKKWCLFLYIFVVFLGFAGSAEAATWISGTVPKMPGVPQSIGMVDKPYLQNSTLDCRGCHLPSGDLTTGNMHHASPTAIANGCTFCHTVTTENEIIKVETNLERPCIECHAQDEHHKSSRAQGGDCAFCHNSSVISSPVNPPEIAYYTPSISTPSTSSCNNCHQEFNPDFHVDKMKPNRVSHHSIVKDCGLCHNDEVTTPIRQCETCHSVSSLHTINGHIANQQTCLGCHEEGVMSEVPTPVVPPSITALGQVYGEPGQTVSIFGANFGDGALKPDTNHVWFVTRDYVEGNVYALNENPKIYEAEWINWYGDQIDFILPVLPERVNYSVYVETELGRSNSRILTTLSIPSITRIYPNQGVPGDQIIIEGACFNSGGAKVLMTQGSTEYELDPVLYSDSQLQVTVPPDLGPGPYDISVRNNGGTSNAMRYVILAGPYLEAVDPSIGRPGSSFTIIGTGLDADDPVVTLDRGDVSYTFYPTNYTATSIRVDLTYDVLPGTYQLTLDNLAGVSNSVEFTILVPAPTITRLSPSSAPGDSLISIFGADFTPDGAVIFSQGTKQYALTPQFISAYQLDVVIPQHLVAGIYQVSVTTSGGGSNIFEFQVLMGPPGISNLSATEGLPGSELTIYGNNYSETDLSVQLSQGTTTIHVSPQYVGINEIKVNTPTDLAPGDYNVTVNTEKGSSNSVIYTILQPTPTLTSIIPVIGKAGDSITINGTRFTQGMIVTMTKGNTIYKLTPKVISDTTLQVTPPPNASPGTYSVVISGPSGTSAAGQYTVGTTPRISSISPNTAKRGTTVVISGQYLDLGYGAPKVYFGGVEAVVISYTDTIIQCQVPSTLREGKNCTVTVNNGYATSSGKNFTAR